MTSNKKKIKYWDGPDGVYYNDTNNEILLLETYGGAEVWNIKTNTYQGRMYYLTHANDKGQYQKRLPKTVISYSDGEALDYLGEL
jgi:hypothetical protein